MKSKFNFMGNHHINKKNVALLFSSVLVSLSIGCGSGEEKNGSSKNEGSAQDEILEGRNLISQSDCMGCHKEDAKLVGPSYLEIANYYEANEKNINMLGDKIVKGGQGAWGKIPMAPHPVISEQDAQKMVKYILSLKK